SAIAPQAAEGTGASLSLVDRFETILESGRRIATGLSESVIYQEICAAACQLLRVHHGVVLKVEDDSPVSQWTPIEGRLEWELDPSLIEKAFNAGRAVARSDQGLSREHSAGTSGDSQLCVPLYMRGKPVAC